MVLKCYYYNIIITDIIAAVKLGAIPMKDCLKKCDQHKLPNV